MPLSELISNPFWWGLAVMLGLTLGVNALHDRYKLLVREEWPTGARELYRMGFLGWLGGLAFWAGALVLLVIGCAALALFCLWYLGGLMGLYG